MSIFDYLLVAVLTLLALILVVFAIRGVRHVKHRTNSRMHTLPRQNTLDRSERYAMDREAQADWQNDFDRLAEQHRLFPFVHSSNSRLTGKYDMAYQALTAIEYTLAKDFGQQWSKR